MADGKNATTVHGKSATNIGRGHTARMSTTRGVGHGSSFRSGFSGFHGGMHSMGHVGGGHRSEEPCRRVEALSARAETHVPSGSRESRFAQSSGSIYLTRGGGPESAECAWPAQVDDAVSSEFAHAFPQRGIGHQRSNGACEVFHVV